MARVSRPIGQFLRRAVLQWARQQVLPGVRRSTRDQLDGKGHIGPHWSHCVFTFRMESVRSGVEALESLGIPRAAPKVSTLEKYEAELKAWRRRRTIARNKVAQLQRLVRYHRRKSAGVAER